MQHELTGKSGIEGVVVAIQQGSPFEGVLEPCVEVYSQRTYCLIVESKSEASDGNPVLSKISL